MKIHIRESAQKLAAKYKNLSPLVRMRIKGGAAILVLMCLGVYATTQIFGNASDVTGVVFHDYNGNGKRDNAQATSPSLAADRGVAGITVRGFGADGTLCDTRTTDANGAYTLQMGNCNGGKFRVEFSGLPAGYNSSQVGTDSKTTTQFVAAGTSANLGIYSAGDFCQNNPKLATSCLRGGAYNGDEGDENTVYGFPYGATGTDAPSIIFALHGQTGATYAQTYRPASKSLYSAAFMRRHDGIGPGGTGAIYVSKMPASGSGKSTPSLFATIPNAGGDTHPVSDNNCNSKDGQSSQFSGNCWAHDQFSFDAAGKRGLGGMALYNDPNSSSGDALLVVNLNDRKIYKVSSLDNAPASVGFAMPLTLPNAGTGALANGNATGQHQGCITDDVRPFAVTVYNNKGYVGLVCSAQTTRKNTDLRAYVYSFDPATMTFAGVPTMEFPLNYDRSCAYGSSSDCPIRATWNPWISQFNDPLVRDGGVGESSTYDAQLIGAPQPELVDLAFGDNGSLTLGFRDRFEDQVAYEGMSTNHNSDKRYNAETAGDLLRACLTGATYTLESGGTCSGAGPGSGGVHSVTAGLPQGIGGYEFYNNDFFAKSGNTVLKHDETSWGAVAQVPGFDTFASTATSPLDGTSQDDTGGIRTYNSNDGAKTNSFRIYQDEAGTSFMKGNSLGDVTVICDSAPIEIGNRVWKDTNGNGVQDSTEPGIANVTVTLKNKAGTVIATAITDPDGNYLFSNRTQDENGQPMVSSTDKKYSLAALTANTSDFSLSLSTPADYTDGARLQNLHLSPANMTANNGDDQNDSDATTPNPAAKLSASNPAVITFSTGPAGANNHTYDFGFNQTVSIGNFVWLDSNKNGRVDGSDATQGINGVKVNLYYAGVDSNNDGSLSASELSSAVPAATQVTTTDTRNGPTNGRPGYYQFNGLAPGDYFVAIDASSFADNQPLHGLGAVPVPAGVGDTQDDNANHGTIPAGGSLSGNGVVSTKINLKAGSEPTTASSKPDDDDSSDSDTTIDFGFWHSYSLGNRVWLDKDNSATINTEDGNAPGVANVTVRLLNSTGSSQIATTTTDKNGYYRFDNLDAGTYIVEIAASNFSNTGALKDHKLSSIGPGEELDPDMNGDNNDNGINPSKAGQAVRSGTVTLGPGASEPTGETDLSSSGQGTDDSYANMTVDFGFIGTTSFGDTVYYDLDGDGTQDANEPGIPNVTVTLNCAGNIQTMKTDASGKYLFTDLPPGTCTATVTQSDVPNASITTAGSFTHSVSEDNSYLDADFGFRGNGTLGNQVWKEPFANGVYSPSEGDMGVGGVVIELYMDLDGNGVVDDSDVLIGTKTTDDNGRYQFTNLPVDDNIASNGPGMQYVVKVTDPNHKLTNLQASTGPNPGMDNNSQNPAGYGVTLTPSNNSNQTADFGYHGFATVGDTVFYDTDNDGIQDPNEPLVPNIKVTLTYAGEDGKCSTTDDNASSSMMTDANGNYLFTNLLGGEYCISIVPSHGTVITTNNQGQQFTLGPTQTDLTRDFGLIGDGTIGNQVFIDYNENGKYDGGDVGISGVTIDLYRDDNRNGVADAGEQLVGTQTTNDQGQYGFTHLVTGDDAGVGYVVVVTDTGQKLTGLTHVAGDGTDADNQSKPPTGYPISLTPDSNNHPEADFGYKANPGTLPPPKFWKKQDIDRTSLVYTLTWINQSSLNDLASTFYDTIPDETTYEDGSLQCQAKGSSSTTNCSFNKELNRIEWSGKVGADLGHLTPDVAVNPIVVTFRVKLNTTALTVYNQGFGSYGTTPVPTVPSDWQDTPQPDDPTVYTRTPTQAAIQTATGGTLANTGQVIIAAIVFAVVVILFSVSYVIWSRRTLHFK